MDQLKKIQKFKRKFNALILQRNPPVQTLELLQTIVSNIKDHPADETYTVFKRKPYVRKWLETDTGNDLLKMLGFVKKVHQFEEKWVLHEPAFIQEAVLILTQNVQLIHSTQQSHVKKIQQNQKETQERTDKVLSWIDDDRTNVQDRSSRALTVSKKPSSRSPVGPQKLGKR